MQSNRIGLLGAASFLFAALASGGVDGGTRSMRCVLAIVEARFELPDGTLHDGGQVKLCQGERYSPALALHSAYVNGDFAGVYVGREARGSGGAIPPHPYLRFGRTSAGTLVLAGYAVPEGAAYREFDIGPSSIATNRPPVAVGSPLLVPAVGSR